MPARLLIGFLIVPGLFHPLFAQINYDSAAAALHRAIQLHFYQEKTNDYRELSDGRPDNKTAYLWSMGALWQADNELEAVGIGEGLMEKDLSVIQEYEDTALPSAGYAASPFEPGKKDRFYDDNQWLGIAAIDAFRRTKDILYLNMAKRIYRFMMTGLDSVCGGGIYWNEADKATKNTCSNGPGIVLSLKLYLATKNKNYRDTALLLYHWVNSHLRAPDGLYYDNINVHTGKITKWQFSYNAGTMLESNVLLFSVTNNKMYLKEARKIASAAKKYFYGKGIFKDNYWFNAVMLRAYRQLFRIDPDRQYLQAFQRCLDHALHQDMGTDGLVGKSKTLNLVAQSGMLEMLAGFAGIKDR